ncbi:hypothetical protein NC797_17565 [Aquibacillus sp. 3ASR75-11]|uniref:Uncharacterized protein n=1 Tax=Terrihalobacillus insolitus TaxID=2950438 RepID=A0A9X4AQ56_9BACI|nr:hypothetical protein [Terrihalobacillus insolitus]MDC3426293.1 hypothetical protein [Terrihalobacillus insolitus]
MEALEINKDMLHKLIDSIPNEKLPKAYELFIDLLDEDDEKLTEDELAEIDQANGRFKKQRNLLF